MITSIKNTIAANLKSKFPECKIYDELVKQGFKTPCFFIKVIPITTQNLGIYKERTITIDIQYFSEDGTYEKNYIVLEELENMFIGILNVEDRNFTIENAEHEIVDNVLHFMITLNFVEGTYIEEGEYGEEIYIKE